MTTPTTDARSATASEAAVLQRSDVRLKVGQTEVSEHAATDDHARPDPSEQARSGVRRFLWEHSLTLVLLALFLATLAGQIGAGIRVYNLEQQDHGEAPVGFVQYLTTGHFIEALTENWESEWLQMAAFVLLTVFLRQKGSPESKSMDEEEEVDREPDPTKPGAPAAVRAGGVVLWLYANSLVIAFLLLFVVSFFLHAAGGARDFSEEQLAHGQPAVALGKYLATSRFWFESMQNWQSEFLSIAAMVYLSVYLRQKGSPESKPVDAPHGEQE